MKPNKYNGLNTPNYARRRFVAGVAAAVVLVGAVAGLLERNGSDKRESDIMSATTMFHGDIDFKAGSSIHSTAANDSSDGAPDGNWLAPVPDSQILRFHDPLEVSVNGVTYAVAKLPGSGEVHNIDDLTGVVGYLNLDELSDQGLATVKPSDSEVISTIQLTEQGAIQDPTSGQIIPDAATSSYIPIA